MIERRNSIANALELCLSCTNTSILCHWSLSCLVPQIARLMGLVGPRWAPWWPHEPCYQGQVMAVTCSETNHYLNQCWLIFDWAPKNKLQWNFHWNSSVFFKENTFEIVVCKMAAILFRLQCIKVREERPTCHPSNDTNCCCDCGYCQLWCAQEFVLL